MNTLNERIQCSGEEKRLMHYLQATTQCLHELTQNKRMLERLKTTKLYTKARQAEGITSKLLDGLYNSVPLKQLQDMYHFQTHANIDIHIRRASPVPTYHHIATEDLKVLLVKVLNGNCAECLGTQDEIKQCTLKPVIDRLGTNEPNYRNVCPYCFSCLPNHRKEAEDEQ